MRPDEPGAFHVETVEIDGAAELRLVGELDMDTANQLAVALEPVYARGVGTLVLDLSELKFIDEDDPSSVELRWRPHFQAATSPSSHCGVTVPFV